MTKTKKDRIGLMDIGSNTIRLVVYELSANHIPYELQNVKTPARLSQYVDDDGVLSAEGIAVLITAVKSFKAICDGAKVNTLLPMATAAVRNATNQAEIVAATKEATGVEIQIVSDEHEAFYGQYAVAHSVHYKNGVTIDIGGGSAEITHFEQGNIINWISLPFGVVSLKEHYLSGKNYNDKDGLENIRKHIRKSLKELDWLKDQKLPVIGIGGSARNIANVHQRQVHYPLAGVHGYEMSEKNLEEMEDLFTNLSYKDLTDLDGLSRDRRDIIIPATIMFEELLSYVGTKTFVFSNRGLREGILLSYINNTYDNPFKLDELEDGTVKRLSETYHQMAKIVAQREKLAFQLLGEFEQHKDVDVPKYWDTLLCYAAKIYFIGNRIEPEAESQHTFYIVSNSNLNGFKHHDRVIIAALASYKNKSLLKQYLQPFEGWFSDDEIRWLIICGGILKFSDGLTTSHLNTVKSVKIALKKNKATLYIYHSGTILTESYLANRRLKHLNRIIAQELSLEFIDMTQDKK